MFHARKVSNKDYKLVILLNRNGQFRDSDIGKLYELLSPFCPNRPRCTVLIAFSLEETNPERVYRGSLKRAKQ